MVSVFLVRNISYLAKSYFQNNLLLVAGLCESMN